ncbi:MAG: transposase, partial [SAR324 cluster bacterium]|nr:transposase [SAR324 cluster bacterium]
MVKPLSSFRKLEKRLAMAQRRLSRMVRFSENWNKQKKRIQKIHIRIANARNDFLHKTSTKIANENQV